MIPFDARTAEIVVEPEDPRPGAWAGAPSALLSGGTYYLAYRLRRPVGEGRGFANVVARSEDGVHFETLATLDRDYFGGESLERPALVRIEGGTWRVYVSVATPGTKHWRVDLLEATTPEGLAVAEARTVMPGDETLAVKDPVVLWAAGRWHAWASCHPLEEADATDRMTTEYATSLDGIRWLWHGTALAGRPGHWDSRGTRVSAVLLSGPAPVLYYDGRATAEQNWEERTGVATVDPDFGHLVALGDQAVGVSPHGSGGLRYLSVIQLRDGSQRSYFEVTREDGAHDLRTAAVPSTA